MTKRKFSPATLRERLKLDIAAHCRSDLPVRNKAMDMMARAVGVYSHPATLEMDLMAYIDQVDSHLIINELFSWTRVVATEHAIPDLPTSLPQFQLELV